MPIIGRMSPAPATTNDTALFITRWQGVTASELSTAQSFVIELCDLLGVPRPHPTPEQDYMFERPITFAHGDGSQSPGRVDCYRRGAFVLESKKLKPGARALQGQTTKGFDDALLRARSQAENYARALPATEGRPPFVVVVDVGHVIELYAEFTRSGSTYTPFPDPRSHRIRLADLADAAIRQHLALLWTDPLALDPARTSARVTRRVAVQLAELAQSLEASGHRPEVAAAFLTRCLFSMFAEDVGLLPAAADGGGGFVGLLKTYRGNPAVLQSMLRVLWTDMDRGGFSPALAQEVLRFNGKLFKGAAADGYALLLTSAQIDGLLQAAKANWREVEPAIFGTLLERALHPDERHALGAHYTPRAYVERLVLPTVVDPLRADWANAQAAALLLANEADALDGKKRQDKLAEARAEIHRFHHQLCTTRVLDPACGSGNFLYVTLEHLKRLEGEVLNQLDGLGETQDKLALDGETVTLQQLRGIEINERAAALAELVLWIGWLQWHVRTRGLASVAEPVVHDYGNIECRDAVLAYDRIELAVDAAGKVITRWDGKGFKPHPVTGERVPDEAAQVAQWVYVNPRQAEWPKVNFIVGNPPYLGARTIRQALGDGYLDAVRSAHPNIPDNADFVMYWWDKAARLVSDKEVLQFGLITTKSVRQPFNQVVLDNWLRKDISLAFAIPNHPWVDASNGAAVRIAMTVVQCGQNTGSLQELQSEKPGLDGEVEVQLNQKVGVITSGLKVGVDISQAPVLRCNTGMSCVGYQLSGQGFVVNQADASKLDRNFQTASAKIRSLMSGRDITQRSRGLFAIDLYGLSESDVRSEYPAIYQRLHDRVKPERDINRDVASRSNWHLFARPRSDFRPAIAGLSTMIATALTAKHRSFVQVSPSDILDSTTVIFALCDQIHLGVLSSEIHVAWSLAAGGRLGVGDDPRYNKTRCFEAFPFPAEDTGLTPELSDQIRQLAEQLNAHRKARQVAHEAVTLTGLYNVLAKLRSGEPLNAKDKLLHEQGLVSVLHTLHDDLDAAVLQAYGWADLGSVPWADEPARQAWTETLLQRLVALNARRAAEEAQGLVRWLRPEFQDPARRAAAATMAAAVQQEIDTGPADAGHSSAAPAVPAPHPITRRPWPTDLPAQMRAVADALTASPGALDEAALAEAFTGRGPWKKRLPQILQTLEALGRARAEARAGHSVWRAA